MSTVETPEQALTDDQIENREPEASGAYLDGTNYAIGRTGPSAEVVAVDEAPLPDTRRPETWPHDDVRRLTRALDYVVSRGVGLVLLCHGCEQTLTFEGRDNGGASLMGCRCAVRRWL